MLTNKILKIIYPCFSEKNGDTLNLLSIFPRVELSKKNCRDMNELRVFLRIYSFIVLNLKINKHYFVQEMSDM